MSKEKKDLNDIAAIEKAIKEKYGEEAIQNPKRHWDEEKEKKYLENLTLFFSEKMKKKVFLKKSMKFVRLLPLEKRIKTTKIYLFNYLR